MASTHASTGDAPFGLTEQKDPPRQSGMRTEYVQADRALRQFDEARALAEQARGEGSEGAAARADDFAWSIVREADPVRLSYASAVLGVADQTTRDWTAGGLLEDFGGTPLRVGLESVARVRELAQDLRAAGHTRDLMTAVLRALELDELGRDNRFRQSLKEMQRGERG